MTCLEAQSNIISYIDDVLDKDKKIEFLKHIENCDDCKEELDIYYTMIEGMRQLDSNMPLSRDFRSELELRINRELKQNKQKKSFFRSSVLIVVLGIIGFGVVAYINFLNILYNDEQNKIKEKQGEYYCSEYFDDVIFEPESRVININIEPETDTEESFYSKIRRHNAVIR